MPLDRDKLLDRLDKMYWLKHNWDGFGTPPICRKAYDIATQMIAYIQVDVDMRIFVGVDPEGSVFSEIIRPNYHTSKIELTVLPDGNIEYEELEGAKVLSRGGFLLSYETINDVLR